MPNPSFDDLVHTRNPQTHQSHRREVFWQITVPLIVSGLLLAGACALPVAAVSRGGEISVWADISLIWLIVPGLFFSLIPLALLATLVYGMVRLLGALPSWMFRLQMGVNRVRLLVSRLANQAAAPVIRAQGLSAGVRSAWQALTRRAASD